MWVKIAQERVGDATKALCPCLEGWYTVHTDPQNLGFDPIKPIKSNLVGWDLARSYGRPGQWKKCQDDIVFTQEVA